MTRTAFYPGSFDPVTNGHVDVVSRACGLADRLVLGVGVHPGKAPMFSAEERVAMLTEICAPLAGAAGIAFDVITFDGLVVAAAAQVGATLLVRGLRDASDFDYEMRMASMNAELDPRIRTIFLPASPGVRAVAATHVRQIAAMGGDVSSFTPDLVARRLASRFGS